MSNPSRPIIAESLESRLFFSLSAASIVPHMARRSSLSSSIAPAPAGTGITGEYFVGDNFQTPVAVSSNTGINFSWRDGRPVKAIHTGAFAVRWTGQIDPATTDTYTFYTKSDSGTRVIIGGTTVIDNFASRFTATVSGSMQLTAGTKVSIEVDYVSRGAGAASMQLLWSSSRFSKRLVPKAVLYSSAVALPAEALTGYYFTGQRFNKLALVQADPSINLNADLAGSLPQQSATFSVRWIGTFVAPVSGLYQFHTVTDDGVRLWIDGINLIDRWSDQSPTSHYASLSLTAGQLYAVRMDYYENGAGGYAAKLLWTVPGSPGPVYVPFTLPPPPPAPLNVMASPISTSQINLTWNDVAGEIGFIVQRSTDGGATFSRLAPVGAGVTTFSDTGLTAGTGYEYEVIAVGPSGNSAASTAATGTTLLAPPAPVTASASIQGFADNITWTASLTATSYLVERSPNGSSGWMSLVTTSGTSTSENGLPAGSTLYYRVTAINGAGSSAPSNVVNVTTPPVAPTHLTATVAAPTQIDLNWNDVHGETGFQIFDSLSASSGFVQIATVGMGTTSFPVGGLTPATGYYFLVVAVATNAAAVSGPSNIAHATTTAANPSYAGLTTLYGLTNNGNVYSINTTTGAQTQIGTLSFGTAAAGRDPISGNFFYVSTGNSTVAISQWNPNDGVNTVVNPSVPLGSGVAEATFRDDGQFFVTTHIGDLYTNNSTTGAATLKGSIHANGAVLNTINGDMAFAPDNTLFIETSSELYSITNAAVNAATGSGSIINATDIGPTNTANLQIAFGQNGVLFATDANGQLYTLNPVTGAATTVGAPSGIAIGDLASVPLYGELSIAQSASALVRNATGTYTMTVSNGGPDTTVGPITLIDTLASGVTYQSGSGTGWTFSVSGATVTMTYTANVAAGASAPVVTLDVAVGSTAANNVTNTVSASTTEFETNTANNINTISSPVTG